MIIVTGCHGPDLDGVACMIAYSELLNIQGTVSESVYSGELDLETAFVKNYTNYFPLKQCGDSYPPDSKFVLVDTANPDIIDSSIPVDSITKVFDHRQLVFTNRFSNAELHIELVGSCATLIAEEFQKNDVIPSQNTSIYLYSAIIFSTINFQNAVTTDRDIQAAKWLFSLSGLDENYKNKLFSAKSKISSSNLYEILSQDFSAKTLSETRVGIAQIEMVGISRMEGDLRESLEKALKKLKDDYSLKYIFFNGIDVIEGYSLFVTIDPDSLDIFSSILEIPELEYSHKYSPIVMRKQIWPKVEAYLSTHLQKTPK